MIGLAPTQTINCDYLNVTRGVNATNIELASINGRSIQDHIKNDETLKKIGSDIETIKKQVNSLLISLPANNGVFQPGKAVQVTILFEDIDIASIDSTSFQESFSHALSLASGRGENDILILDVQDNDHSTIATAEVHFKGVLSESQCENFIIMLNSGYIENFNLLKHFAHTAKFDYEINFSVDKIKSINSKIYTMNSKLSANEINFANSESLILGGYKIKSDRATGALFIQKYDEIVGEYVGGTIVTD